MRQSGRSSPKSAQPIDLPVSVLPWLPGLILALQGMAAIIALKLQIPEMALIIVMILLCASSIACLAIAGLSRDSRAICHACWHEDGSWTLRDQRGMGWPARLNRSVLLTPWIMLLSWQTEAGWSAATVLQTNIPNSTACRRLRARVRQSGGT